MGSVLDLSGFFLNGKEKIPAGWNSTTRQASLTGFKRWRIQFNPSALGKA
jgi:hypothetical protein